MGFWDYLLDNEYKQRDDINSATESLAEMAYSVSDAQELATLNRKRLDRLELTLETLFRYLERSGAVNREEFVKLMEQVDLEDGALDGKIGPDKSERARKCSSCGKPVSRKRDHCVYCNAPVEHKTRTRRRGRKY